MTTHPARGIVCLLGAFVLSTGLAQEGEPAKAFRASWMTNRLPVLAVLPRPIRDVRYDANGSDVGLGMQLNLAAAPLRFDGGPSVPLKPDATQWRRDAESAERENLRLMEDYRWRSTTPANSFDPLPFRPSAVESVLSQPGR